MQKILTLDALVGIIHADLRTKGATAENDIEFREAMAKTHPDYSDTTRRGLCIKARRANRKSAAPGAVMPAQVTERVPPFVWNWTLPLDGDLRVTAHLSEP